MSRLRDPAERATDLEAKSGGAARAMQRAGQSQSLSVRRLTQSLIPRRNRIVEGAGTLRPVTTGSASPSAAALAASPQGSRHKAQELPHSELAL